MHRERYKVNFGDKLVMLTRGKDIAAVGIKRNNNMYCMLFKVIENNETLANVSTTSLRESYERLGHLNKQSLQKVIDRQVIAGVKLSNKNDFFCESCQYTHRLEFKKRNDKLKWQPGEYIHTDVCGIYRSVS